MANRFLEAVNRKVRDALSDFFAREQDTVAQDTARGWRYQQANAIPGYGQSGIYPVLGDDYIIPMMEDTLLARYARYEEMDSYPETCLHGDTLVHTVDGPVAIRDLEGTNPHVFSFDLETGEVVLDQAAAVVKTGEDLEIVRVVLDNGRILRVTPNHRFLCRDGQYVEAGDLNPGQSLMPFRTRIGRTEYMEVFQPGRPAKSRSKRWEFMYRVVSRWKHGRDAVFGEAVHHDDLCRLNDHPDNLLLITSDEHTRIHAEHINRMGLKAEWTDEMRAAAAERMRGNTRSRGLKHTDEARLKMSEARRGVPKSREHREKIGLAQPHRIDIDPDVLDALVRKELDVAEIARRLGVSWSTAKRRISKLHGEYRGHDRRMVNCKVLRVESAGRADVYDLQAPRCQNFAAEGVFVHNSLVLDLYSDDSTVRDQVRGHVIWAESKDKAIEKELNALRDKVGMEKYAWTHSRTTAKYGNNFGELLTREGDGVVGVNYLPTATMRRVEDRYGKLLGFYQIEAGRIANLNIRADDFQKMLEDARARGLLNRPYRVGDPSVGLGTPGILGNVILFEPGEIVHWRLRREMRGVYGLGVLETADWVWRRLRMLEDAVLVHKLTRAPGRFAFYVNTHKLPPEKAWAYVKTIKSEYKKRKFINPKTGQLDTRFSPLSVDEDFWIPIIRGEEESRIDTLSGPDYQGMDEVEFFLKKLYTATKIPRQYMDFAENMNKSLLSSDDVRFARAVMRLQNTEVEGYDQIGRTHLYLRGYNLDRVERFGYHMSVPSAIFELAMVEVMAAKADLASRMQEFVSVRWILQHIFKWSEDEIDLVFDQWAEERVWRSIVEAIGGAEGAKIQGAADVEVERLRSAQEQAAGGGRYESSREPGDPRVAPDANQAFAMLDRQDRKAFLTMGEDFQRNIRRILEEGNRDSEKRMEGRLQHLLLNHQNEVGRRFRILQPFMEQLRLTLHHTRMNGR